MPEDTIIEKAQKAFDKATKHAAEFKQQAIEAQKEADEAQKEADEARATADQAKVAAKAQKEAPEASDAAEFKKLQKIAAQLEKDAATKENEAVKKQCDAEAAKMAQFSAELFAATSEKTLRQYELNAKQQDVKSANEEFLEATATLNSTTDTTNLAEAELKKKEAEAALAKQQKALEEAQTKLDKADRAVNNAKDKIPALEEDHQDDEKNYTGNDSNDTPRLDNDVKKQIHDYKKYTKGIMLAMVVMGPSLWLVVALAFCLYKIKTLENTNKSFTPEKHQSNLEKINNKMTSFFTESGKTMNDFTKSCYEKGLEIGGHVKGGFKKSEATPAGGNTNQKARLSWMNSLRQQPAVEKLPEIGQVLDMSPKNNFIWVSFKDNEGNPVKLTDSQITTMEKQISTITTEALNKMSEDAENEVQDSKGMERKTQLIQKIQFEAKSLVSPEKFDGDFKTKLEAMPLKKLMHIRAQFLKEHRPTSVEEVNTLLTSEVKTSDVGKVTLNQEKDGKDGAVKVVFTDNSLKVSASEQIMKNVKEHHTLDGAASTTSASAQMEMPTGDPSNSNSSSPSLRSDAANDAANALRATATFLEIGRSLGML